MRETKSKKIQSRISEVVKLKAKIKALQAEVSAATQEIKEFIGEPGELIAGNYLAVLTEQQRTSLDRKGLVTFYGTEAIEQFERVTTVKTLNIKAL